MVKVRLNSALREETVEKTDNVLGNVLEISVKLSERHRNVINRLKDTGKRNVLENAIESSALLASFFKYLNICSVVIYFLSSIIIIGKDQRSFWNKQIF